MQIPTFKMIKSNVRGLYEGTHPDPDSVPSLVDTWCDALADDRANHAAQITTLTAERDAAQRELAELREAAYNLLNASEIWASPPLGASIDELAESFEAAEDELRESLAAQKGGRDE